MPGSSSLVQRHARGLTTRNGKYPDVVISGSSIFDGHRYRFAVGRKTRIERPGPEIGVSLFVDRREEERLAVARHDDRTRTENPKLEMQFAEAAEDKRVPLSLGCFTLRQKEKEQRRQGQSRSTDREPVPAFGGPNEESARNRPVSDMRGE